MKLRALLAAVVLVAPASALAEAEAWSVRADWGRTFEQAGVGGTIVVVDERSDPASQWVHDQARAQTRFIPASTFKIPHALFALDIDMPNGADDLPKREAIGRAVLRSIGALPSEPTVPSGREEAK
jgi:beta-lactamase class D